MSRVRFIMLVGEEPEIVSEEAQDEESTAIVVQDSEPEET